MAQIGKNLTIPSLPKIHLDNPELGKALQAIVDHINQNVTPFINKTQTNKGNKVR